MAGNTWDNIWKVIKQEMKREDKINEKFRFIPHWKFCSAYWMVIQSGLQMSGFPMMQWRNGF